MLCAHPFRLIVFFSWLCTSIINSEGMSQIRWKGPGFGLLFFIHILSMPEIYAIAHSLCFVTGSADWAPGKTAAGHI